MKALKFIYNISLASIVFWLLLSLFLALGPVEIRGGLKDTFIFARGIGLPFAILLTLTGTLIGSGTIFEVVLKVILTLAAFIAIFWIMVMLMFADMCSYNTSEVLFLNKNDSSDRIVVQDFGCGATDSSPATIHISRIKYFAQDIMIVKDKNIDTTKIDQSQWQRIPAGEEK